MPVEVGEKKVCDKSGDNSGILLYNSGVRMGECSGAKNQGGDPHLLMLGANENFTIMSGSTTAI